MASGPGGSQVLPRGTVRGRDGAPPPPSCCTRGLAAARTAAWPWTSPCTALPLPPESELPAMLPCSIYLLSSCPASPTAHTDRECQGFHSLAPKKNGSHSAELQINNLGAQRLFARAPCLWQPPASSSHLLSHLLWVGETGDSSEQSRGSIMK